MGPLGSSLAPHLSHGTGANPHARALTSVGVPTRPHALLGQPVPIPSATDTLPGPGYAFENNLLEQFTPK